MTPEKSVLTFTVDGTFRWDLVLVIVSWTILGCVLVLYGAGANMVKHETEELRRELQQAQQTADVAQRARRELDERYRAAVRIVAPMRSLVFPCSDDPNCAQPLESNRLILVGGYGAWQTFQICRSLRQDWPTVECVTVGSLRDWVPQFDRVGMAVR